MRPTLLPNLRRLWRGAQTVQIGTDPTRAVVLELPRPELARVLDLLDGSYTETALLDQARTIGVEEGEILDLLKTLREVGMVIGASTLTPVGLPEIVRRRLTGEAAAIALRLRESAPALDRTPAEVLRRRGAARVLVTGDGPLLAPLAAALAASGVGHVDPAVDGVTHAADVLLGGLSPDDVNSSRAIATAAAVDRAAPGTDFSPVRAGNATFVVRVGSRYASALATRGVRLRSLPRLEVGIRLGTVVVGPLVRPHASPCRACLDLHRLDRDPGWPVLAAQLATSPDPREEPCTLTTALAGAAFAADEVLTFLDGGAPRTEAAMVEISRPGELRRRVWAPHPRCDCRRRRRTSAAG